MQAGRPKGETERYTMNVIPKSELKKCPRCNKPGVYVFGDGILSGDRITGLVSCIDADCMPETEIYTISEWQNLARPESPGSRADHELAAAELSVDVRDVRLEHALDAMIEIATTPYTQDTFCTPILAFLNLHPSFDNPTLDEKAARLRELVS